MTFVRGLRPRYRTGLLSNAFHSLRPALTDRFPIADAFDAIVISAEEGLVKPDRRIYEAALLRLGVAAQEAVFVDDFEENCEGARAVGMHAVRFESAIQARQAVESLLAADGPRSSSS
jgi:putative hydrolase of the HAD superfamily